MAMTTIMGVIYGGPTRCRPWGWTCKLKRQPVIKRTVVQAGKSLNESKVLCKRKMKEDPIQATKGVYYGRRNILASKSNLRDLGRTLSSS